MSILAGVCSLLLFLITPAAAGAADEPALCAMSGCSCTRHVEDDSISTLSCAGVGFTSVPSLEMYPNLTQLNLEGNQIGVLRATDLEPVRTTLKLLDLDRNGLHTIEEGALKDLPKLQHLFLSHNELTVIPAEVFDNKQEITTLDMSHNNLTAFPAGFNSVHAYTTFLINNNPIGNLSRGLFHGTVTRIETLDISYIGMTTFDPEDAGFDLLIGSDGRPGLSKLYMDGNILPVISNAMMKRLPFTVNTLSMRYCGIELLRSRAFTGMPGLRRLLLDGNNLGHLRRSPFYGLQLELLDLANCNIQNIRKDAFEYLYAQELNRVLRWSKVTSDEQTRVQCTQNAATCESPPHSLDGCSTEHAQNDPVKNSLVADERKMDYSTFDPVPKTEIECMKQYVDSSDVIDKVVESDAL